MLTLIERKRVDGKLSQEALFKCGCGNIKEMNYYTAMRSISCGCYKAKRMATLNKSHGLKNHPLYNLWINIKRRCLLPDFRGYVNYGARGIAICDEWANDVVSFYNWSMANGYRRGLQIDRIDNDGNYEPSNCRWTTAKVNSNNRRSNKQITYKNQTHTLAEWAEIIGKNRKVIGARLREGWPVDRAFNEPVELKKVFCLNNNVVYESAAHAARELNCGRSNVGCVLKGKTQNTKGYKFEYA